MSPPDLRSSGYVGAIASVSAEDVPALYEGGQFYSPAVGDANKSSLTSWLTGLLDRNGPVSLRRPEAMAPDTPCISLCVIGSGSAMADLPPSGNEFSMAVRQIEQTTDTRFGAIYPLAAATVSALAPVVAASQLGLPLIDADGMGRTFALIHHTSMHLAGVSATPLVAQGPTGESVLVKTPAGPRADRILRGNVDALGGWAALAAYPTTAGVLRSAALPGTISRLINVGRVLLQYTDPDQLLVRLAAIIGCRRIGRGRIVELEHLSRPTDWTIPAHPSSLVVQEIGGLGRQLRIELRSEIVAVFADGELVAAAPDLLCLFDVSRGVLATLDSLEPGDLVDVLATPADAIWYSPEGMAMVGLGSHGIPLPPSEAQMSTRPSTLPLMLADLLRIEPLASAKVLHLAGSTRTVAQVVLAESFERLRRTPPHSLVVLHAEAATGGWSLAAALHLAWERNFAGVIVTSAVAGASSAALAARLNMSLLLIDGDPVDVALQLAGQISTPAAARALRQALCAEKLTEQTSIRGVLTVLNTELGSTPVALVAGDAVLAGRAGAIQERPDVVQVSVPVNGPGETWARLVAGVPSNASVAVPQVEALLKLARPSLLAAWAQTRLNSATHAAQEAAAFGLLRRLAGARETGLAGAGEAAPNAAADVEVETPSWSTDLGWQVGGMNRAVWIAPRRSAGPPPDELTHLVRQAWQRGRPTWPLITEDDGWISWQSSSDSADLAPLRKALNSFADSAETFQLAIGVGRGHRGVPGLMRSVAEARLAAHVARQAGQEGVQWFEGVGAPAALAWLPTVEIAKVADLCLGDLMAAHDRVALVDTALAVMDCGGSLVEASHRLGVHRNTVLARIVRAKQLGLVFDDPSQRLALHVLCYALASLREPAGR